MFRLISTILFFLVIIPPAISAEKSITDIQVTGRKGHILVSASYKGGFTEQIKKEMRKGIPREFFYYIVLKREIPNWLDEEKTAKVIKYTIKFNTLKNQFIVLKEVDNLRQELIYDSYEEMLREISRIENVEIAPLSMISSFHRYYVSIKAEIKAGKLPFLLKYFMFFIPYSEFSTDWVYSEKFTLGDLK